MLTTFTVRGVLSFTGLFFTVSSAMASDKRRAMSAALRCGIFADADVHFVGSIRWVHMSALHASKRRFAAHTEAELLEAMPQDADSRGRPRFLSTTDFNEVVWVRSRDKTERATGQ